MLKIKSLKQFFLVSLLAVVTIINIAIGLINYIEIEEQVEELFDAEMAQMARTLQSLTAHTDTEDDAFLYIEQRLEALSGKHGEEYSNLGHRYEKKLAFQIWYPDGRPLLQSATAQEAGLPQQAIGFHAIVKNEQLWRTFTLQDAGNQRLIQVAQREEVRSELTQEIGAHAVLPNLLAIPLLGILIMLLVNRSTRHLQHISSQVQTLNVQNLEPINLPDVPAEILPLIHSLNQLLYRIQRQSERERKFTADAAHELRTPLAAIKVQLQSAQLKARGSAASDAIDKSLLAVDRLAHLVEQLLLLSRLDQHSSPGLNDTLKLSDVLIELISDMYPAADQIGIRLNLEVTSDAHITSNRLLLFTLLRNLIENSIRYAPAQSDVNIVLDYPRIDIRDHGPGIDTNLLEHVFERFYRVDGDQGQKGAGLGLAICKEIAHYLKLDIQLENRQPGLCASLTFHSKPEHHE